MYRYISISIYGFVDIEREIEKEREGGERERHTEKNRK